MMKNNKLLLAIALSGCFSSLTYAAPSSTPAPDHPSVVNSVAIPTQLNLTAACVEDCNNNLFFSEGRSALQELWKGDNLSIDISLYDVKQDSKSGKIQDHAAIDVEYALKANELGEFQLGFKYLQNLSAINTLGDELGNNSGAQMNIGWQLGDFSTQIANRYGNTTNPENDFFILNDNSKSQFDLNIAWRTSTDSQISIGARNLFSKPSASDNPQNSGMGRVPYIQYKQNF